MTRIVVVEDDENLRFAVAAALRSLFEVIEAESVRGADTVIDDECACVVFDRKLPDGDAMDYVRRRRMAGWTVPVLFLTALDTVADRVAGFAGGADDYLTKPFSMAELVARVHVLTTRATAGQPALLRCADLEIDWLSRRVRRGGVLLTLADKEYAVLEYLALRQERVVSRAELIDHCWDERTDPMSNVVDVTVGRLRRKLREPNLIQPSRGRGYRLMVRDDPS